MGSWYWNKNTTVHCVIELGSPTLSLIYWVVFLKTYDQTLLWMMLPSSSSQYQLFFSSSRINWWKLWLSMDCLSIWQAGHYLANGNIVIIPKWAIMLDQLYEAATSVSWKAKFCVNLYRGWTPSSFFDHQISSLEWCSVMAFKNASARFGSYHTRIQQLSAKNQSLKMLQFRN